MMENDEKFVDCCARPPKKRKCCCCLNIVVNIITILFAIVIGIILGGTIGIVGALGLGAIIVLAITLGVMSIVSLILYYCCCKPKC